MTEDQDITQFKYFIFKKLQLNLTNKNCEKSLKCLILFNLENRKKKPNGIFTSNIMYKNCKPKQSQRNRS